MTAAKDTFYLTTPIYYVNDVPHIGHAYTTVAADALARWKRLNGHDVYFLTGTDEHGQKVARAAEERGMAPQDHADDILPRWQEMLELLAVSQDDFIRTTEERHTARVQEFMQLLYDNGDLYKDIYAGPYCVSCEAYYTADELVDGRLCPIHRRAVEEFEEENYFFRLTKYSPDLLRLYDEHPEVVRPEVRLNEVKSLVENGLRDVSVTRTSFDWGVPVPWDSGHVFYVWFDALLNYVTAPGYGLDPTAFGRRWPADVHIVGKDIVRMHAVWWPAMLIAAGVEVPRHVFAHGFLLVGGEKMSKTSATGISAAELIDHFGRDCYRYYFLREISFGQDGTFSWESMEERYTNDLANDLGNLANRVLNMVTRYCDGVVPEPTGEPGEPEAALEADRQAAADGLTAFDELSFKTGLEALWRFVGGANRYVEARAPWALNKQGENEALQLCLYTCVDALAIIAVLVSPVMPDAAEALWAKLGTPAAARDQHLPAGAQWGHAVAGALVEAGAVLFPRLEE
jgi:methionyl-tRNA synthetase